MKNLTLAFVLLLASTTQAAFIDVTEDTRYADSIDYLQQQGVVQGYGDGGTFGPANTLNRVELLKIVLEASDTNAVKPWRNQEGQSPCFPDLETNAWYLPYVCYAKTEGIIEGFPDGTFKPQQEVTLAEAAKIIVNTVGSELPPEENELTTPWYAPYVQRLSQGQKLPGSLTGLAQPLPRAEMAAMVARIMQDGPKVTQTDDYVTYAYLANQAGEAVMLSEDYTIKNNQVHYENEPKPELDARTFSVFHPNYDCAVDKDNIIWGGVVLEPDNSVELRKYLDDFTPYETDEWQSKPVPVLHVIFADGYKVNENIESPPGYPTYYGTVKKFFDRIELCSMAVSSKKDTAVGGVDFTSITQEEFNKYTNNHFYDQLKSVGVYPDNTIKWILEFRVRGNDRIISEVLKTHQQIKDAYPQPTYEKY